MPVIHGPIAVIYAYSQAIPGYEAIYFSGNLEPVPKKVFFDPGYALRHAAAELFPSQPLQF